MTHQTPAVRAAEKTYTRKLARALKALGKQAAAKLLHLGKASSDDDVDSVALELDWMPVATASLAELSAVSSDGAKRALALLGVEDDESITSQVFTDAVEWARARSAELVGKSWDEDGALVDNPDASMAISDATRDDLREAVAKALEDGDSAAELAERIEGLGAFGEDRALTIARTEIIRANANGQMAAMRGSGVVKLKAWSTATEDVCDDCLENEDAGDIDIDDDFPSGDDCPPAHPSCLPGDALVTPVGVVTGASKRWYDGELVVVRVASGKQVACTPNHPILTPGGWVAASSLNEGSQIICAREWPPSTSVDDDHEKVPARIQDVAEAFGRSRNVTAAEVPLTAEDFHGDGAGGEVAVVWANGQLRHGVDAALKKSGANLLLERACPKHAARASGRSLRLLFERLLAAADSFMRSLDLPAPLTLAHMGPTERLRFGLVAGSHASLEENAPDDASVNVERRRNSELRFAGDISADHLWPVDHGSRAQCDAGAVQSTVDSRAVDAVLGLEARDALSGDVFADIVVEISRRDFSGHVFNLQTTRGFYVAGGILTHNCRCAVVAAFE